MTTEKKGPGKPTIYTQKLAETICQLMCEGMSLREICRQEGMPHISSVMLWVVQNRADGDNEPFSTMYDRAFRARAYFWAEDTMDIADDGSNDYMERNGLTVPDTEHIQRSRLRVDTRKFFISRLIPSMSEKQEVTHKVTDDGTHEW